MIPSYIICLFAGDKYCRSISIGLSNTNFNLLHKFRDFFTEEGFSNQRIKFSVYLPVNGNKLNNDKEICNLGLCKENIKYYKLKKGPNPTYMIYVNSRSLKRSFFEMLNNITDYITDENKIIDYGPNNDKKDNWN